MPKKRSPIHRLSNCDFKNKVGTCSICGQVPIRCFNTLKKEDGSNYWYCVERFRIWRRLKRQSQRKEKQNKRGNVCTWCGFTAQHPCQIDAHHPNGRHGDNINITISLCGNCHRYETWKEKHNANKYTENGLESTYYGEIDIFSNNKTDKNKQHCLSDKNIERMTAICSICGPVKLHLKKNINRYYCSNKFRENHLRDVRRAELKKQEARGLQCFYCGFAAKHYCQIDWHHINGNHSDNRSENKEPVCVNCHRLISYKAKHHLNFMKA